MSNWTDERRQEVIAMYNDREPTPENSLEIVKEIADEIGETANGVRAILTKAGVYLKKSAPAASASKSSNGEGTKRVSKEAAHQSLIEAIEAADQKVDSEIISKLTGKAALYLAEVIKGATN